MGGLSEKEFKKEHEKALIVALSALSETENTKENEEEEKQKTEGLRE